MRVKEIIEQPVAPAEDVESDPRDLFEMANLYPDTTGLPMTVWVSPRGDARHDVRVKVNMAHGNQMSIANTAVVSVRPTPRVIAGQLSPANAPAVPVGRTEYGCAGRILGRADRRGADDPRVEAVAAHRPARPTVYPVGSLAAG